MKTIIFTKLQCQFCLDPSEQLVKTLSRGKSVAGLSSRKRETKGKKEDKTELPFKKRKTEQAATSGDELQG